MKTGFLPALAFACLSLPVAAQVNSGSDGHDGALNPTANLVIDMADHPDGIYHDTSVNIPVGVKPKKRTGTRRNATKVLTIMPAPRPGAREVTACEPPAAGGTAGSRRS